jgi:hypothetical protein
MIRLKNVGPRWKKPSKSPGKGKFIEYDRDVID